MKFACVEYTTKTGTIWRPTPERPNYRADPDKEIDPTSFGCYTTALNGEHIPLSGLIYGSLEHSPSRRQRLRQDLTRRVRGAFGPYSLQYLEQFDTLLVIFQTSYDDELIRFTERVRKAFPNTILVSCSSPPFGRLREHWKDHPATAERYRAFLNASHVNMNVCRATVPYYRLLSDTASLYLPQPYPVEYAREQTQGASDRRPIIYVAGDTVRPDIMTSHLIAKVLQERHPDVLIRVTKTPGFRLNTAFLSGTRFVVVPFRPWAEQLRELATVRLVINTDLWWTRGRVPVDCAAAGVPCVGTTSDGQTELWPDLATSDSTDIERLVEEAERALTDEDFRIFVIAKAKRRLTNYTFDHTVRRFSHAVNLARSNRLAEWRDPVWDGDVLTSFGP